MTASEQLKALAEETWSSRFEEYPEFATMMGDHRFDDRLTDASDAARLRRLETTRGRLARLDAIDAGELSEEERITADVLRIDYENAITSDDLCLRWFGIDQLNGAQVSFPTFVQNFHPKKTAADWENLIKRYQAFGEQMSHELACLEEGVSQGYNSPRIAVERVLGQLDAMLDGEGDLFADLADAIPETIEEREALAAGLRDAASSVVRPAFEEMRRIVREVVLPKAHENTGLWQNPRGDEIYAFMVKRHLGKAMDPQTVHELGLAELESITKEMDEIAAAAGMSRDEYAAHLASDATNFHSTKEALLAEYEALIRKAEAELPRVFGRIPKEKCIVKAVEEYREKDAPTGFYMPPPEDGSRPGMFYANLYKPETRLRSNMACLTYHEAVPGHHLQISIAQGLDLPAVRRHGHFTAYVEGWALYTERLCDELGLYDLPRDRFGMLGYQSWRASRLVVDTGLHALRWDRSKALEFLTSKTVLPESEVKNEIDRYLVMPAQALSYKIGEIEIRGLRAEAEERLGEDFELKDFHDKLLEGGAVPLETLATIMREWMKAVAAEA